MWEEIKSTCTRVFTMHGIQRHVKNQRSIQHIDNGNEEVRNLNSSVHRYGRNLNVLRRSRVKRCSLDVTYYLYVYKLSDMGRGLSFLIIFSSYVRNFCHNINPNSRVHLLDIPNLLSVFILIDMFWCTLQTCMALTLWICRELSAWQIFVCEFPWISYWCS